MLEINYKFDGGEKTKYGKGVPLSTILNKMVKVGLVGRGDI